MYKYICIYIKKNKIKKKNEMKITEKKKFKKKTKVFHRRLQQETLRGGHVSSRYKSSTGDFKERLQHETSVRQKGPGLIYT